MKKPETRNPFEETFWVSCFFGVSSDHEFLPPPPPQQHEGKRRRRGASKAAYELVLVCLHRFFQAGHSTTQSGIPTRVTRNKFILVSFTFFLVVFCAGAHPSPTTDATVAIPCLHGTRSSASSFPPSAALIWLFTSFMTEHLFHLIW